MYRYYSNRKKKEQSSHPKIRQYFHEWKHFPGSETIIARKHCAHLRRSQPPQGMAQVPEDFR